MYMERNTKNLHKNFNDPLQILLLPSSYTAAEYMKKKNHMMNLTIVSLINSDVHRGKIKQHNYL